MTKFNERLKITANIAHAPASGDLTSRDAATRDAAVARRREALANVRDEQIRSLGLAQAAAGDECDELVAATVATAEGTRAALAAAISTAWYVGVSKHARAWIEEPTRKAAEAIRVLFVDLCARARLELGEDLRDHVLAFAFADELARDPGARAVLASEGAWYAVGPNSLVEASSRCAAAKDNPAAFRDALAELERRVATLAHSDDAKREKEPAAVARYAVARSSATHRDHRIALEEHIADHRARDLARTTAEYVMPANIRVARIAG